MKAERKLCANGVEVVIAIALLLSARPAPGDGGAVQLRQTEGRFVVTVFTAPTPLRAGAADVSVLVQDRDTSEPVLDAEILIVLTPLGWDGAAIHAAATRAVATNKLLYAAVMDVPLAGAWDLRVTVRRGHQAATVTGKLTFAPRLPPLLAHWPYLAFPPVVVLVFVVHQWRRSRSSRAS
jgi:hypothetical protein